MLRKECSIFSINNFYFENDYSPPKTISPFLDTEKVRESENLKEILLGGGLSVLSSKLRSEWCYCGRNSGVI